MKEQIKKTGTSKGKKKGNWIFTSNNKILKL